MTDWIELKDLQEVAGAQRNGWEIEESDEGDYWYMWTKITWRKSSLYRGRPKQPKKVTVTSECYRAADGSLTWVLPGQTVIGLTKGWARFPAGDITGEVKEWVRLRNE